jgi:hypothetical protein
MSTEAEAIARTDAAILARIREGRPDLDIARILPWLPEDGPYMRAFELADGQTAVLAHGAQYRPINERDYRTAGELS